MHNSCPWYKQPTNQPTKHAPVNWELKRYNNAAPVIQSAVLSTVQHTYPPPPCQPFTSWSWDSGHIMAAPSPFLFSCYNVGTTAKGRMRRKRSSSSKRKGGCFTWIGLWHGPMVPHLPLICSQDVANGPLTLQVFCFIRGIAQLSKNCKLVGE